mmetsp:Transcript_89675/g.254034  ORF Transcript_89675/g.254034 Transcript_89675/m.254034 type:complete len:231 (+) Transcript_89675:408-1100(+)
MTLHQISTSCLTAAAKPPARKTRSLPQSPELIVPSGNQAQVPPATRWSSNLFITTATASLSTSTPPSGPPVLKGTQRWPETRTMRPTTGISSIDCATIILNLPTLASGADETARIVSRKDVWLQTMQTGRPEAPRFFRYSASPSHLMRIHQQPMRLSRQKNASAVISAPSVSCLLGASGPSLPRSSRPTAKNQAGSVEATNESAKPHWPAFCAPRQPTATADVDTNARAA